MKKTDLEKIVKEMQNPKIYPHPVKGVKFVQTQMSCVFLTGDYVYKVKKPVNFGFLDYTTLEKRKKLCETEIELNRRLSPEIYLGVTAITKENGKISLEGGGDIVEYAVKMKQLPKENMLSTLLRQGKANKEMIKRVAEKIAKFHQEARTNRKIAAFGKLEIIVQNCQENFVQTQKYIARTIPPKSYKEIKSWTENFIVQNKALFEKRIKERRVRDCHGDLHSEHICIVKLMRNKKWQAPYAKPTRNKAAAKLCGNIKFGEAAYAKPRENYYALSLVNQRESAKAAPSKGGINTELCSRPSESRQGGRSDQRKSALNNKELVDASAIYIYDCIEFNERFRYGDVASEVAFLAMDLDFYGEPELSNYFAECYVKAARDKDLLKLIQFYKCYRAYVRGKVESFKLDDARISQKDKKKAGDCARKYFTLSSAYICRR